MKSNLAIVVTSISAPNPVLRALAEGSDKHNHRFIVIGDVPSPPDFSLDGCEFYDLDRQSQSGFRFAEVCPRRHYARKNIGYLYAIEQQAELIVETDDDNIPFESFWGGRERRQVVPVAADTGWLNVYRYFSEASLWPRGLPLDAIHNQPDLSWEAIEVQELDCPIQQGLADDNPDVDAIYRLTAPLPQNFRKDRRLALSTGAWCPFNSQNTTWWADAFPLLYLPAYCSFRMTDIWRSFVAQRIAWVNGWGILFHEPTVWQQRNEHDLMRDFKDEIPGYLHNRAICEALAQLDLPVGVNYLGANLRTCYEALVQMTVIDSRELDLVDAWLADLQRLRQELPSEL